VVFDREKFKSLVHYVIARAGDKPGFGATKLNKVLWFADARLFMLRGRPITGAAYIREKYGPVPQQIMPVRDELVHEGRVRIIPPHFEYEGWRFRSLRPPEVSSFTAEELQTVNWWIDYISDKHTAASISDESHDYGWDLAKMGEPLPLQAFMAERIREPSESEMAWARDAARRLGIG
jgi:hypothetical protein